MRKLLGLVVVLFFFACGSPPEDRSASSKEALVTAIGPDGRGVSGLALRLDMVVGGVPQDYGTLSARSVVTNSDGVATAVYTAPPSPVNGLFGTCSGLPGNCVSIVATATGTNFTAANPELVTIRLVPTGVIQPPAGLPTAQFTISPIPVNFNVASTFDASSSSPGSGASAITSYAWNFGDGSTGTGKVVSHTYTQSTSPGNSYNVTLTVANDRGLTATTTQAVSVDASPAPAGDWVFSPSKPSVGDTVFFNADGIKPAAGHTITQFSWNFGDGASATGVQSTHVFTIANTYRVVLTVIDDAGQKTVVTKDVEIGTGNPSVVLVVSKTGGLGVQADGSGTTTTSGTTVSSYTFNFGDGSASVSGSGAVVTHTYLQPGTYTVRLTTTDSIGRVGTTTVTVTVP